MKSTAVLALVACAGIAGSATADIVGNAVTIHVSSPGYYAAWSVTEEQGTWENGVWTWATTAPIVIEDNGVPMCTMDSLSLRFENDPVVSIAFAVTAASTDTIFSITSGVLTFAPFAGEARASASATLTDNDGNGGLLTGFQAGGDLYRANLNGAIPGPTAFANLVPGFAAGSFASPSSSEALPAAPGTFTPVGVISSMQAQYSFQLSANDSASGTSVFVTRLPAPGAIALMGLGGLVAARRRR